MITIFTPTYNRAYSLPDLYESLCRQTSKDFEWIVVDDGSTDNTKQLVDNWIGNAKFPLRYFYQQNAGKHIAINKGVKEAKGDLFFIVDSDDHLADNAVECYLEIFKDVKDDARYAGISAIRANANGQKIGSPMPFEQLDCTILDFGMKYKINGDMAEAYKTEVLRKFPFPQFEGERFITESVVWIKIAQQGLIIRYVNKPLYLCEYRPDGLSASITRRRAESPKGCMLFYSNLQKTKMPFVYKCKAAINYWRFALWAKDVGIGDKCKQIGWLNVFFYPIGLLAYFNDKMQLSKQSRQGNNTLSKKLKNMLNRGGKFSYCVAIRTLGKAGEMYQQELDSLMAQTVSPRKILVYIPDGYPLPKETVGVVQYVRIEKGMVAQRVLPTYDEVDDNDFLLLLDDDCFLPPDAVEKLWRAMEEHGGDCIAPDVFRTHETGALGKLRGFVTNWARPRRDDGWAFKISRNGSFSYNNCPRNAVCLSESAAGPCSLWRKSAFKALHLEDELWLDKLGFAYGDDLLEYNKIVKNGYRLLVHYDTGIIHLDAQSSRRDYATDKRRLMHRSQIWFTLWWRISYDLRGNSKWEKMLCIGSYGSRFLWDCMVMTAYSVVKLSLAPITMHIKGVWRGWKYVHSEEYKKVPNFLVK